MELGDKMAELATNKLVNFEMAIAFSDRAFEFSSYIVYMYVGKYIYATSVNLWVFVYVAGSILQ